MKLKGLKKAVAFMLALVMMMSAAACGDKSWSVKNSDQSLAAGVYIYYMYSAYMTAANQRTDTKTAVLSQTIEEKNAADWIKDKAMESCKMMLAVDAKMKEMNLSLTDAEIATAKASSDKSWASYGTTLTKYGISQDSFYKASALLSAKYTKLFEGIYGKGGTKAVSDAELQTYFTDNYIHLNYFYKALTTKDASGNAVAMTDDQIAPVTQKFNSYVEMLNGGKTVTEVANTYQTDEALTTSPLKENIATLSSFGFSDEVNSAIKNLTAGKAAAIKSGSYYYFFVMQDIKNQVSKLSDSDYRLSVLGSMKSDEFDKMVEEAATAQSVTANDAVTKKYQPSMFA